MASRNTPAVLFLERNDVAYTAHEYELADTEATYGESVAAALGVPAARLYKTLVGEVDGRAVVAVVPTDRKLSLEVLASAVSGRKAKMADSADAERWTGYVTGGISPFGQKRRLPVFVDATTAAHDTIFVSGGRRGLQVELAPQSLVALLDAQVVVGLGA